MHRNRLIVPEGNEAIKQALLKLAHDDLHHLTGYERPLIALHTQARVYWFNMADDVRAYVKSCYRCEFGKAASHSPSQTGHLNPTLAPHVHHTVYVDIKGIMPHDTGYLLAAVEAITRTIRLRYLPKANAKEVIEELREVFASFGTTPIVLRTDGGQPFDSAAYKAYCREEGITPVVGIPHHSQGQGLVENRFKLIAGAIIATLGHKAPREWFKGQLLADLERHINNTYVSSIGSTPFEAMHGFRARTRLSASTGATDLLSGFPAATSEDLDNIIAAHHSAVAAAQGKALLASSLAQALTKREYDAAHAPGDFKAGQWYLLHCAPSNRLLPHFTGPYQVTSVSDDNNFVRGHHFLSPGAEEGPHHVSRCLHFDKSRAPNEHLANYQLEAGSFTVEAVQDHRVLADGSQEFLIRWLGYELPTWATSSGLAKVIKVQDYCRERGIPMPGKEPKPDATGATPSSRRTSGRARR